MADRRMGWVSLPVTCPTCSKRIREHAVLVHGGAVRCQKCNTLLYAVMAAHLQLAFVAEVSIAEVRFMQFRQMTLEEVLGHLGASFPPAAA